MHLALAAAHVQQHDHRDQRKRQAQQAFADKRRQQFSSTAVRSNSPRNCQSLLLRG
jgi:hypothetical protein